MQNINVLKFMISLRNSFKLFMSYAHALGGVSIVASFITTEERL